MRSTFFVLIFAAACGSSSNNTPDAAHSIDSPRPIDAAPDARPDAPPDAAIPATERIWVVGDYATNNTVIAGVFTNADSLPATPTQVPTGVQLASTTGYTQYVFDATRTTTAYVANVTTSTQYDLYVAGADGTNPTLLVAGQPNVEIATIALSPDGTKVAFMMDSATYNNAYDVWVVNTTGTPVPLMVSPTRPVTSPMPALLSAFTGSLTWSADSKWIGFSGDLTTDGHSQAYIVDTTAATPAATELLHDSDLSGTSSGVRGPILFDANDSVYFRAGLTDNVTFTFFQWDGTNRNTLTTPARGDASASNIGSFAISSDGATMVFSADAPTATAYDLYATPIAAWNPVKLTNATLASTNPPFSTPIVFSPDNTQVAFIADYITDNVNEPFVAPIDGSGMHRLTNITVTNADAELVNWTVDGTGVYVQGDLETNNDTKLYRLDPTLTDGMAIKAVDAVTSGDITNFLIRPM